jgi:hypothetical protein
MMHESSEPGKLIVVDGVDRQNHRQVVSYFAVMMARRASTFFSTTS